MNADGHVGKGAESVGPFDFRDSTEAISREDTRITAALSVIGGALTGGELFGNQNVVIEELTGHISYDFPELLPLKGSEKMVAIVSALAAIFETNIKISAIRKIRT